MRRTFSLPELLFKAAGAFIDLAAARIALRRIKPQDIIAQNRRIALMADGSLKSGDPVKACDEAAFFIGRMAVRVPWRSDCLVQALAGQRWLLRAGVPSEIVVGAAKRTDGSLDAHAWLRFGHRVILGGNVTQFQTLIDPET